MQVIADTRIWRRELESFLIPFRNTHVFFLPTPGNGGDSLISAATYEAFKRAGIEFTLAGYDTNVEGQTVFLGGGGNLVPMYSNTRKAFESFLGRAARIVLLPHTIRGHEDLLACLDETCTLFVRDWPSLAHVRQVNPDLDVRLAHDMAFHLDVAPFMANDSLRREAQEVLDEKLKGVGLTIKEIQHWPSVDLMRLDGESVASDPVSDADISDLFMMGVNPEEVSIPVWCFLRTISLAQHVNTDRLHVGIGAAMLGTPCTLRENTYGKNAAVFEHSLMHFPGVRLVHQSTRETTVSRTRRLELERASAEVSRLQIELEQSAAAFEFLENKADAAVRHQGVLDARCAMLAQANDTLRELLARHDVLQIEAARLRAHEGRLLEQTRMLNEAIDGANAAARAAIEQHASEAAALHATSAVAKSANQHVEALLASNSWRVTAPFRLLSRSLKR